MIPYSPFSKTLTELEIVDLSVLREVAEGWYVDYKREVHYRSGRPDLERIAKSLSAFANSYGGWLFYGIGSNEARMAESYNGVPVKDLPSLELALRIAAAHHVNPPPYFDHRILKGPCEELGLSNDRAVIVIKIPYGPNAPYVHSSGVIYRRVADESDPKRETDRAVLDLLWERGRRDRVRLSEFLTRIPTLSKAEEDVSFLVLFLMSDPLGDRGHRSKMSFERFSTLMTDPNPQSGGIPFDNFFTMSEGLIARHVANNDPYRLVLTWQYYHDCSSVVTIPFSSSPVGNVSTFLDGYNATGSLLIAFRHKQLNSGWVLDLNVLFHLLAEIICRHRNLMEEEGYKGSFYAKAHLENIWRRIPFLDTPGYTKFLSECGIPIIQDQSALAPAGTDPDTLVELSWRDYDSSEEDVVWRMENSLKIFIPIIAPLALPHRVFSESRESIEALLKLLERAMEVQKRRSAR